MKFEEFNMKIPSLTKLYTTRGRGCGDGTKSSKLDHASTGIITKKQLLIQGQVCVMRGLCHIKKAVHSSIHSVKKAQSRSVMHQHDFSASNVTPYDYVAAPPRLLASFDDPLCVPGPVPIDSVMKALLEQIPKGEAIISKNVLTMPRRCIHICQVSVDAIY